MRSVFRKPLLLSVILILTGASAFSQKAPVFKITTFRYNFGLINEKDGKVSHSFPVENPGGDTLVVLRIKNSAVNIEGSFVPNKIPPGGKGEVILTFDPSNEKGKVDKNVSVRTNDPQNPIRQFGIIAEVVPGVKTLADQYPVKEGNLRFKARHVAMDKILSTGSRTDTVRIYNDWKKSMHLSIKSTPDYITWRFEPSDLSPGKEGMVILTYDAGKSGDFGTNFEYFYLLTNDSLEPEKLLTLGTNVLEDFSYLKGHPEKRAKIHFETVSHDFGTVKAGETLEFSYPIENNGKGDLIIRKAKPSCGCTVAKLEKSTLKPGEKTFIKVTFSTNGMSGEQSKSVSVVCNDPDNPSTMLTFSARIEN